MSSSRIALHILAVLMALLQTAAAQEDGLGRARSQLADAAEAQVRQGADACARANDVPAVTLLLELLSRKDRPSSAHLAPAHYRDIAWEGLVRITDLYARRRVEQELREARDPWVRQWCAELLGIYADATHGEALERALRDREVGVRRAAARALGRCRYKGATRALESLAQDRDPVLRANATEALARLDPEEREAFFVRALADKDGGVRCALLGALAELYPGSTEEHSVRALADEDWRPRMQAVENLGRIRTKGAVDGLIRALEDGRPVVAAKAVDLLQALTGQRHRRTEAWQHWWSENRETFEFPEGAGTLTPAEGATVTSYHGIRLASDHVAFLIDKSRAMSEPSRSAGTSKAQAAQSELEKVLEALDGRLVFNVFAYHEQVRALDDRRPLPCNRRTQRQALDFVAKSPSGNAKDIWQVLERVVSDPDLDTAYLLSSGEPDIGTYVHWNRVTWHLAELNRFHKVTVHTIVYSDNNWYREQLQRIAQTTGGEFTAFD